VRYQEIKSRGEGAFLMSPPKWHVTVQYFVDGNWLSLDGIMAS
jgi:hypothetical protein